jgi:hypothetical protein
VIGAALLQIVLGIPLAYLEDGTPPSSPIGALNILTHLLLMAGLVGLAQSGATGRRPLATVGLSLSQLGFVVIVITEACWLLSARVTDALFGLAAVALMIGLLLTGAVVVSARQWRTWHRFTPLVCGVFMVALLLSFALHGFDVHYAIGLWGVCWLLFGLSLRAEAGVK